MTEPRPTEGATVKVSTYLQNAMPTNEQTGMIASAYGVIGEKNEAMRRGTIIPTELTKERPRQTYEEKPPNNDIRALTRPK